MKMNRIKKSFLRVGMPAAEAIVPSGWMIKSVQFQKRVSGQSTLRVIYFDLVNDDGSMEQSANCAFDVREDCFSSPDQLDGVMAMRCAAAIGSAADLIEWKKEKESACSA